MIDERTFGKEKVAIVLADLINKSDEPDKLARKVGRVLTEFIDRQFQLYQASNISDKAFFVEILFQFYKSKIQDMPLPEKVKSYLLNLLTIRHLEIQ